MRHHVVLLGSLLTVAYPALLRAEIPWRSDFEQAQAEALRSGKPMLVDYTADWCAPCKAMERDFWPRPDVAAEAGKFVCVRLDFDRYPRLAARHGVTAIPAVVFFDPWGDFIGSAVGFADPDKSLGILTALPDDFSPLALWQKVLKDDAKNLDALRAYATFYEQAKLFTVSMRYYETASRTREARRDPALEGELLLALSLNQIAAGRNAEAEKSLKRFLKRAPDSMDREAALFGLVVAHARQEEWKKAEKTLAELATAYPDSGAVTAARDQLERARATSN